MFTLLIDCGNAAFDDEPGPELARILRGIADRLESGDVRDGTPYVVRDINGNNVGTYSLTGEEKPPHYAVVVGNVGTVYDGTSEAEARAAYAEYVDADYGRGAGESVVLMFDGEIIAEREALNAEEC